jgi:poly-gamma-glutamate capsule biosynthesis protein CapA/YwtB (metallophosphatase superfamily)
MKRLLVFFAVVVLSGAAVFFLTGFYSSGRTTSRYDGRGFGFSADYEVVLLWGGDVMMGRGLRPLIAQHGPTYPFAGMEDVLSNADVTFINLESPITDRGRLVDKPYVFRADPATMIALTSSGVDVVGLANNHNLDSGREGLADCIDNLRSAGIQPVGSGGTIGEARSPALFDRRGVQVGILAYNNTGVNEAGPRSSGSATGYPRAVREDVYAWRPFVDVLVVTIHWGAEYKDFPLDTVVELARQAIDDGADLVVGHHPHVPQGIELYRGGLIAYSLGNLVFDQRDPRTRVSYLLRTTHRDGRIVSAEVIPVELLTRVKAPSVATGEIAAQVLDHLAMISAPFGTEIMVEGEVGRVVLPDEHRPFGVLAGTLTPGSGGL